MKQGMVVDGEGFVKDVMLIPDSYSGFWELERNNYGIAIPIPEGLYKPRFDLHLAQWTEGATKEELEEWSRPYEPGPSVEEQLKSMQLAINYLLGVGGKEQ
ncbi:hypothetical protein ABNF65_21835 [Paenibacillus larvae]